MSLYPITLVAHSYLRWAVLGAAFVVIARTASFGSTSTSSSDAEWTAGHESAHRALLGLADGQFALGVLLWAWLSPISAAFLDDPRHAVHDHVLRFFGLEHATMMVLAIGILHGGRRWSKKAGAPRLRRRRAFASVTAFVALVVPSIPWPGLHHGRPLFRTEVATERASAAKPSVCPPLYEVRCAMCHGTHGRADGIAAPSLHPPPRNFTDPKWQAATSDVRIRDVVKDGGFAHGLSAAMPAQPDLTPADLDALVACVRSFSGK